MGCVKKHDDAPHMLHRGSISGHVRMVHTDGSPTPGTGAGRTGKVNAAAASAFFHSNTEY